MYIAYSRDLVNGMEEISHLDNNKFLSNQQGYHARNPQTKENLFLTLRVDREVDCFVFNKDQNNMFERHFTMKEAEKSSSNKFKKYLKMLDILPNS